MTEKTCLLIMTQKLSFFIFFIGKIFHPTITSSKTNILNFACPSKLSSLAPLQLRKALEKRFSTHSRPFSKGCMSMEIGEIKN